MPINDALLDILACPKCKGPLTQDLNKTGLVCENCQLRYPIRDDIPVMLIDEAEQL